MPTFVNDVTSMPPNNYIRPKTPWWYYYRQQKYNKRNYLSTEMILRKSFKEIFKEYFENSSLGGIKQIRKANSRLVRYCWMGIFCMMLSGVFVFLHSTWVNIFTSPLIVTVDTFTYPIKKIKFPAVTLCNLNRLSKKVLNEYLEKYYFHAPSELTKANILHSHRRVPTYKDFQQLGRLIDYSYDDRVEEEMRRVLKAPPFNESDQIPDLMAKFAPHCEDMLIKCKWGGRLVNCSEIFHTSLTSLGHCCSFNYMVDMNTSSDRLVETQTKSGKNNGLQVIVSPMSEDYAYRTGHGNGFHVFVHDAWYYPEYRGGSAKYHLAQTGEMIELQIASMKQKTMSEVHKYSAKTRQCMFRTDSAEYFKNRYSFGECLTRCRIHSVVSLCKCMPYFYAHISEDGDSSRICTLHDLRCLNKYHEKLLYFYPEDVKDTDGLETEFVDSLRCPDCLPDCELTYTQTRQFQVSLHKVSRQGIGGNFLGGINLTDKCLLSIYQPTDAGTLHRLDAVAYWYEILSNIGGFSGMIMGIGSYTFMEIFYYILIRLTRTVLINYKIYQ